MTKKRKAQRRGQTAGYFDLIAGPKKQKQRPRSAVVAAVPVVRVAEYVDKAGGFDEEWKQATEASRVLESLRDLFKLVLGTRHPDVVTLQAALDLTDGLASTFDEMAQIYDDGDGDD